MAELPKILSSRWARLVSQPLYLNSIYLIASTAVMAIFGFAYWLIAARLSPSAEVGLATTLVSVMTYVGILSQLGTNVGLIRYLPGSRNPVNTINTSLTLVAVTATAVSAIVLLGLNELPGRPLLPLRNGLAPVSFVVFMVFAALNVTVESVFIALRKSVNILLRNSLLSFLKVTLVLLFFPYGSYGLFAAWALAILITVLGSYFLLRSHIAYKFQLRIHRDEVAAMAGYSAGNYIAGLLGNLTTSAIPAIVTMSIGPQATAHYGVAMSYAVLLFSIPVSVCNALFAEGATHEQQIAANTRRAIKLLLALLLPALLIVLAFGELGLGLFGREYAIYSAQLLSMLTLSSVFVTINTVCWTLLNLKHKVREIIFALAINAGSVLTLTLMMAGQGLTGIGLAWLAGQGTTSIVYIVLTLRHYWPSMVEPKRIQL